MGWIEGAKRGLVAAAMGALVLCAQCARAEEGEALAVQSVSATTQAGVDVLRIQFSRALTQVPAGFTVQSPPRIALDIPHAANALGQEQVDLERGNFRSLRVVETAERTRLIVNLKTATGWHARLEQGALLVALDAAPGTGVPDASAAVATAHAGPVHPIADLDFRRGADGAGRVIVELGSAQAGVDLRREGNRIVVDILRSSLPEGLRRRMDVSDFGTPVQAITATQAGDRVRMVIDANGAWEHSAYQSDARFVLEVRPPSAARPSASDTPTYKGEKLSLNFQSIDVRNLLQVFADFTKVNIVTSDSVAGSLTLRLQDVPWDEALEIILQARNLGVRHVGATMWIAPRDEIAAKEKSALEERAAVQTLEPLVTQSFTINYAKAAEVGTQLTAGTGSSRVLSARGSALAEPRTNQLFVTDIPSRLEAVEKMVAKIDIPVRQVLIEARIVEATESFGKSLGVKLGTTGLTTGRVAIANTYDALGTSASTSSSTSMVSLPSSGAGGNSAATLGISLFNASATKALNLELSALEADGSGRVVSSPRVITANQAKALIEQGTEFPYQQATSSGATSVSFRKATLKLEVTPQITPDGNVILNVEVNKDSKGETTSAGVAIDTKHVQTQALVQNGGTVVIGGIFELTDSNDESRVPVLGELPGVGALFRTRNASHQKTETLVFITPRIVQDLWTGR